MDKNLTPCLVIQKNQFKATPSPYSQTFKRFNSLKFKPKPEFSPQFKEKKLIFFRQKLQRHSKTQKKSLIIR